MARDVSVWSVAERKCLHRVPYARHPSAAAFSPDGSLIVIKDTAGSFLTCDATTGDIIAAFRVTDRDEGPSPVFLDQNTLIDASWAGEIRIRTPDDLTPTNLWRGEGVTVGSVVRAASTSIWLFSVGVSHGHPQWEYGGDYLMVSDDPKAKSFHRLGPSWQFLRGCALSPGGNRVAVRHGAAEHYLSLVDIPTNAVVCTTSISQGGTGWHISWTPDGSRLVLAEKDGFSIRSAVDLAEVGWWSTKFPAAIEFSPDHSLVAVADWKRGVVLPATAWLDSLERRPSSTTGAA